jgi:hypothetical protein
VRGGGAAGGLGAAGLYDDDRLGERDLAGGGEKRTSVADGLHVDDDALRMPVVAEVVDQSPQSTSSIEPTETKAEKPMFSLRL